MIKYNLKCKNKHEFESWFSDSKEFEKLKKKNMIECIFCKTHSIEKSIMAPRVLSVEERKKNDTSNKYIKKMKKDLLKIQKFVEKNFEYVGGNFPREVRNVYYDKRKNKNIYGSATPEETEELKEEGIEITTIPWVDKKEN
tara:strand:- start:1381 stop:1803 length:423 start_codon:yes stop_codon:yes gene_type:complete